MLKQIEKEKKKSRGLLHFTYQTQGRIDLETMRENIPHYQIVNLIHESSIVLPYKGVKNVKVLIDGYWYQAIATISETPYENKNNNMIKLYIYHFAGKITDNHITVLWGEHTGVYKKYA